MKRILCIVMLLLGLVLSGCEEEGYEYSETEAGVNVLHQRQQLYNELDNM
jgi:hypothetical protein